MSKATVALLSFSMGILSSFVLLASFGIQTSTFAQTTQAPAPAIPVPTFGGPREAIPLVPSIEAIGDNSAGNVVANPVVRLDGIHSTGDVFSNATFVYGGGAIRLIQPHFAGKVNLVLEGAAANTVFVVTFFQEVAKGLQPKSANPHQPALAELQVETAKTSTSTDMITPYGQK
jgi:hypothetical protein